MKDFHELQAVNLTADVLKNEMEEKGYVLIRDLIPQSSIHAVLADVMQLLAQAGWLHAESSPVDRIPAQGAEFGDPDPVFKQVYQNVFNLESLHTLPHNEPLKKVMGLLAGNPVLIHPKPIGRLIFPNAERLVVHAHQDYEFMKGDTEFYTVWITLHDCPAEMGSLRILEGSHRFGVQEHERENLHVPEIAMENVAGKEWVGGQVNAGDVLIFHSLTVHAANPNISDRMRISLDCRFQNAQRILNPSNLVFAGESGKSWEKTYAGWKSDSLQYYWNNLPLALKPSRKELEEMAEVAESPSLRARYARMASQLA